MEFKSNGLTELFFANGSMLKVIGKQVTANIGGEEMTVMADDNTKEVKLTKLFTYTPNYVLDFTIKDTTTNQDIDTNQALKLIDEKE